MNSQPDKPVLRLDWCSYAAAKYAVEHWHYSKTMPVGKLAKIGVWEDDRYIGAIVFGLGGGGACNGAAYGLRRNFDMAELQRIAMTNHFHPVTKCLAVACRFLSKQSPGLRLLVSYADPAQGHHGGVYQGAGWIYTGTSSSDWVAVWPDGTKAHSRIARDHVQFGIKKTVDISKAERVPVPGKHRYLMPLDAEMRTRILPLAKPYPKRAVSADSGTSGHQPEGGGANPTAALQSSRAGSDTKDTPCHRQGEGGSTPTPALQSGGA